MAVHAHGHRAAHPAPTNGSTGQGRGKAAGKKGATKAGSTAAAAAVAGTVQRADADGPDAVPGGRRRDGQYSSLYGVAKLLALKVSRARNYIGLVASDVCCVVLCCVMCG